MITKRFFKEILKHFVNIVTYVLALIHFHNLILV
jgi:hypothetical protein